ncbi:MAG: signal peptidase II [candidate division WOR-3 bacterium]
MSRLINKQILFIFILITAVVFFIDQTSKYFAVKFLFSHSEGINIIGNYLRLNLVYNPNLVWGLPIRNHLTYYFLPLIGIGVVVYLALKTHSRFDAIIWGLMLAGALGNFIDRIRLGYVVDFIDMGIGNARWPTYNLADSALVVGIILLIVRLFLLKNETSLS